MTKRLLLTTVAALSIAACGDTDDPGAAATGRDEDTELAFARCMREQGVDVPDPAPPGAGPQRLELSRSATPQKVEAATATCRKKTGGGPRELSAEDQQELRDSALKFARCMRKNGIDLPDPEVRSGGVGIIVGGKGRSSSGPRPGSAPWKRAESACRDLMPGPPGAQGSTASEGGPDTPSLEVSP